MRMYLYQILVNRQPGIAFRYHKVHDNAGMAGILFSWCYLLWLNFAYYCLFFRFYKKVPAASVYEQKRLKIGKCESAARMAPEQLAGMLAGYDVISFDIFDTLIYRPFSAPTDLFYLVGMELEYMDFARIRMEAEAEARQEKFKNEPDKAKKTYEVTLREIWDRLEQKTGIVAETGMKAEIRAEMQYCYANPYMLEVCRTLEKSGKRIVYTTDMYLPGEVLLRILEKNGYGRHPLYVSCEVGKSKAKGGLFSHVRECVCRTPLTLVHVGDNPVSDYKRAKQNGFAAFLLDNPNKNSLLLRAHDMTPIIGGAYRGIVNNRLYCGLWKYDKNYEFGFIYGGLFVLGYCRFIHAFCRENGISRLLFLARDGEVLQEVYGMLYPEEQTSYVHISRQAALKISAGYDRYDYLKKMVLHKVNKGFTLEEILRQMELEELAFTWKINTHAADDWEGLSCGEKLTEKNCRKFTMALERHWEDILRIYAPQREAAKAYFSQFIHDGDKVAAVDIGWAGTCAMALRTLVKKEWGMDAEVIGLLAGTNTLHNAEPYMSEGFLAKGQLVSYLYSAGFNRELWKRHDAAAGYNLYFELLTSSAEPSLKSYLPGCPLGCPQECLRGGQAKTASGNERRIKAFEGGYLEFLQQEKNPEGVRSIRKGILDFAADYLDHFAGEPAMLSISGRDAYAPMLLATGYHEKYLKDIYQDFALKAGVGE